MSYSDTFQILSVINTTLAACCCGNWIRATGSPSRQPPICTTLEIRQGQTQSPQPHPSKSVRHRPGLRGQQQRHLARQGPGHLASQPTLSRFENRASAKDLRRFSDCLMDLYLKTHPGPLKVIALGWMPPMTPPMISSSSASSMAVTKSICITRSSSSTTHRFPPAAVLRPRQHPCVPQGVGSAQRG